MSDAKKLQKLSRQIKLLEHLQITNTNSLAHHTGELVSLQAKAAELDEADEKASSLDFLDVRLAYRVLLEPRMREMSDMIDSEAGRSAVLKRRTEAVRKKVTTIKARLQDTADFEQLDTLLRIKNRLEPPVLRKPKPR